MRLVAAGCLALFVGTVGAGGRSQERLPIKQIDHILLATTEKDELAAFLSETLQLPIVWPVSDGDWSYSTGIAFGNVDLELMPVDEPPSHIISLALQPVDLKAAHQFLEVENLGHLEPDMTGNDNENRWAVMGLRGFGHPMYFIQFLRHDMDERRARFAELLRTRRGGPLGIERVREVRLNVDRPKEVQGRWEKLLGPTASQTELTWSVGDGPAVRLVDVAHGASEELVVEVASLARALEAARGFGIVSSVTEDAVRLDPRRLGGLRLVLVGR